VKNQERLVIQDLRAKLRENLASVSAQEKKRGVSTPLNDQQRGELWFSIMKDFDLLTREVYRLRAKSSSGQAIDLKFLEEAEDFIASISHELVLQTRSQDRRSAYEVFITRYRQIWRSHFSLFLFTASLFLGSLFLGWNIGRFQHDYVPLIVGQDMMEIIIDNRPWFESLQLNPALGALQIAYNNIMVTVRVFLFGLLAGVGGLALMLYNGVMIGSIMGYCAANGFEHRLTDFVVAHGFLELTIIVAGAFASFLVGRTFYFRPFANFRHHLASGSREAFVVACGVTPWLILAAFFEGFISPFSQFSFSLKLAAGLFLGSLFWLWTFWPAKGKLLNNQ